MHIMQIIQIPPKKICTGADHVDHNNPTPLTCTDNADHTNPTQANVQDPDISRTGLEVPYMPTSRIRVGVGFGPGVVNTQ